MATCLPTIWHARSICYLSSSSIELQEEIEINCRRADTNQVRRSEKTATILCDAISIRAADVDAALPSVPAGRPEVCASRLNERAAFNCWRDLVGTQLTVNRYRTFVAQFEHLSRGAITCGRCLRSRNRSRLHRR